MRRVSRTGGLAILVVLAGISVVVMFAASRPRIGSIALGAGVVFAGLLIHSLAREQRRRHGELIQLVGENRKRTEQLESRLVALKTQTEQILKGNRKSIRAAAAQGDRIEERTDAMTRRILADLNAARIESADHRSRVNE